MQTLKNKWDSYYQQLEKQAEVIAVLQENVCVLPESGSALDLASGTGANACFLAKHGLQAEAWDISNIALEKLSFFAAIQGLTIHTKACIIDKNCLPKCAFDVIVVSRFLDRSLSNAIIDALKPGGLLFYQTFTREKTSKTGPNNPEYLLKHNELLSLFAPLRLVFYREYGILGEHSKGLRNEAQYLGQKLIG